MRKRCQLVIIIINYLLIIQYNTVLYSIIPYYTLHRLLDIYLVVCVQYNTVLYSVIRYYTVVINTVVINTVVINTVVINTVVNTVAVITDCSITVHTKYKYSYLKGSNIK